MQQDRRRTDRLPDGLWTATVTRVRAEFDEMPCLRVTPDRARVLFGLDSDEVSNSILSRLADDGFLAQTSTGEYVRRKLTP